MIKINNSKPLDNDKILDCIDVIRSEADENAKTENRQKIVMSNIGLVYKVMQPYVKFKMLDTDDMLCEGVIGINHAIDKFDTNIKCKFSSYAFQWIRQKIQRYAEKNFINKLDQNSVSIDKEVFSENDKVTVKDMLVAEIHDISVYHEANELLKKVIAEAGLSEKEVNLLRFRFGMHV